MIKITESMLQAALEKATEAGLISRRSRQSDAVTNREIMQAILAAALAAAPFEVDDMECFADYPAATHIPEYISAPLQRRQT